MDKPINDVRATVRALHLARVYLDDGDYVKAYRAMREAEDRLDSALHAIQDNYPEVKRG